MKKYAIVDNTNFPIIEVTFTGENATDDNFTLFLEEVKKSYDNQNKIALIFDATHAIVPAYKYQKMQADWLKDNSQMIKEFCAGTAYIIPNIIIRTVLKAIFTLQNQPAPYVVSSTFKEGEDWIKAQVEKL